MAQPETLRVLVIEDDEATRRALILALAGDATVAGATDVAQATRFAAVMLPNVIVLDVVRDPSRYEVDAHELLDRLRARGLAVPPVIVVSARPGGADLAQQLGAAAYYRKPFAIARLAAKIRQVADVDARAAWGRL